MTPAARIEPFRSDDLEALLVMGRESFEHGVGIKDPDPIEEQRNYFLKTVLPLNTVLVVRDANVINGFIACNSESISQLYIRVSLIGRGLGTMLLNQAQLMSRGFLWLYTFRQNQIAFRFYERRGFRAVHYGHGPNWKLDDVRYEWRRDTQSG